MRRASLLVLVAACGRIGFGAEDGLGPARVQHGTTLVSNTESLASLEPIDPDAAFLVFGTLADVTEPRTGMVGGQIDSPTELRFTRALAGANVVLAWHAIEWPGIAVQRGLYVPLAMESSVLVPIGAVDPASTFVVASAYNDSFDFSGNEMVRARLVGTDQLELSVVDNGLPNAIAWQVISVPGAQVTVLEGMLANGALATDLTAADTTDRFALASWTASDAMGGIGFGALSPSITGPTALAVSREAAGEAITFACQLVQLPGAYVQHGTTTIDAGTLAIDVPIDAVVVEHAFAFLGGNVRGATTPYVGAMPDDDIGVTWFDAELAAPTTLRLTRAATRQATATASWFVVELP